MNGDNPGRRVHEKTGSAPRATFFPAAVCGPARRVAWRVPRGVYEHGRLPMDAAPRIASMNFAIAFASLIKGNRGPIIILTVMAEEVSIGSY